MYQGSIYIYLYTFLYGGSIKYIVLSGGVINDDTYIYTRKPLLVPGNCLGYVFRELSFPTGV